MNKTVAIVGASSDRRKYGNKAVRAYKQGGWVVYPINPKEKEIEGLECYPSVTDVPEGIDRVSMYVPPRVGKTMLHEIAAKKPKELFFNPGSEDEEIVDMARGLGLDPIVACSVVNIGLRPEMFPDE